MHRVQYDLVREEEFTQKVPVRSVLCVHSVRSLRKKARSARNVRMHFGNNDLGIIDQEKFRYLLEQFAYGA